MIKQCLAAADEHLTEGGWLLLQVAGSAQDERVRELLAATVTLRHHESRVVDPERAIMLVGRS